MSDWLIAGGSWLVVIGLAGWLYHWYILSAAWWPVVGTEWRAHRSPFEADRDDDEPPGWDDDPWTPGHPGYGHGPAEEDDDDDDPYGAEDDDWGDQLHVINLAVHRDRPVHQLTHYEIEAVIRDLGVPEWVPERWRIAV